MNTLYGPYAWPESSCKGLPRLRALSLRDRQFIILTALGPLVIGGRNAGQRSISPNEVSASNAMGLLRVALPFHLQGLPRSSRICWKGKSRHASKNPTHAYEFHKQFTRHSCFGPGQRLSCCPRQCVRKNIWLAPLEEITQIWAGQRIWICPSEWISG